MAIGVLQLRRGATAARVLVTPSDGEFFVDTDTYEVFVGDGTTAGGILIGGAVSSLVILSKTANYTILNTDSGKQFNNDGAGGAVNLTLPAAVVGLNYAAAVVAAQYLRLTAGGVDQIYWGDDVSAAGGYVRHNAPGAFVSLICHASGFWHISSIVGSWSLDV
jgi:hypothetical protein